MKKCLLILLFSAYFVPAHAQLLNRVRNKIEQKVVEKLDESIDKATQKKTPKESTPSQKDSPSEQTTTSGDQSQAGSTNTPRETEQVQEKGKSTVVQDINSYSKFDFIAGDKVLIHEDFSKDAVGDFPTNWNTRSSAEVVTINNRDGKWFRMAQTGVFYPEYITENLPENFTLQVDLLTNQLVAGIGQWMISFMQTKDDNEKFKLGAEMSYASSPNFKLNLQPQSSGKGQLHYSSNLIGSQYKNGTPEFYVPNKPEVKISIWRQKQRIRVYFDSTKVIDLPRALDANAVLNTLVFSASNPEYDNKEGAFFMSNIRLAVGAPNLGNKLISEGKFSTNGILFDTNSDQIKPQSYGSLQDIATVLKENATVRVKIIGHTDSDGDDKANVDLSKRRADAVVKALSSNFGIDASRMESDGKGEAEPVDSNDSSAGKANNRRVEFVRK